MTGAVTGPVFATGWVLPMHADSIAAPARTSATRVLIFEPAAS